MDTSGSLSTYKRYKLGQQQFQKWLQQTSDRFKRDKSAAAPPAAPARSAKATKAGGSAAPSAATSLHWTELERMAQTVIENETPENIPTSAISILRDVVSLRKKSAHFFAKAAKPGDDKTEQKNAAHRHIINVLDKILQRFEKTIRQSSPSPSPPTPANDGRLNMNVLNNLYEHLRIDEPQQGDGDDDHEEDFVASDSGLSKATQKSKKSQKKSAGKGKKQKKTSKAVVPTKKDRGDGSWVEKFQWYDVDGDDEEDEFDYYMLIYCFFQDFNEVRTYVGDKWCEYFYHKSISVDTLAVVTNAACELFHELEADLRKTIRTIPNGFAAMGDYAFMMKTLFLEYGLDHVDYDDEEKLTREESYNKIYYEADWVGFTVHAIVENVLEGVPPGKVPMLPPSRKKPVVYGLRKDAEGMREFMDSIIFDIFPEACITKAMKTNGLVPPTAPAQDEVTLGFEQLFRVRDYPSAFIFSLSLYVDMRYILEDLVTDAFELLQATATSSKALIEQYVPQIRNRELRQHCQNRLYELTEHIIGDFTFEEKKRRFADTGITEPVEYHSLLKRDPIWAGLLDIRCRLVLNDLGCRFAKESPLLVAAAFIYTMAQLGGKAAEWPRMDIFLRVHGRDRVLRGAVASDMSPAALLRRFIDLDLAVTVADFLGPPNESLQALMQRYGWELGNRTRRSVLHLRNILQTKNRAHVPEAPQMSSSSNLAVRSGDTDPSRAGASTQPGSGGNAHDSSPVRKAKTAPTSQPATPVSPVQLLEIVEERTAGLLENELSVEYFQLHDESILLFLELLEVFEAEVDEDGEFSYDEGSPSDKLAQLLPVLYRASRHQQSSDEEAERQHLDMNMDIIGRVAGTVATFCTSLSEDAAR